LSFLIGVIMFGALIFLPEYQQLVRGDSATKSGLMLLPFVAGIMTASLTSGRLISKFGKYRIFPIIGTLLATLSFFLFSHIAVDTSRVWLGVWMAILGLGIGQVMPVLTLAVQNAVERRNLGTATSTVTFFRSIGSALGGAIFGAILTNRLTHHLASALGESHAAGTAKAFNGGTEALKQLPADQLHTILNAFALSFRDVFLFCIPLAIIAFFVALFLKETPLRNSHQEPTASEL
jgi:MFS family permease